MSKASTHLESGDRPPRELMRCSRDWKSHLQSSALPAPIKTLIVTVVARSRLRRNEKLQVAQELSSHFEDGLHRGQGGEQLIEDFGDPLVAAQLIRSSKIRNRSTMSKLLSLGMWGGLAFILSFFGLTAFFHFGKANPSVDYTIDFNRTAAQVPVEERAWLFYRDAYSKAGLAEGGGGLQMSELFVKSDEEGRNDRLVRPTDTEAWPVAVEKLKSLEDVLDSARRCRSLSYLGLPLEIDRNRYSPEDRAALFPKTEFPVKATGEDSTNASEVIMNQSMMMILLPHYQSFRQLSRALVVDARLAIEQGDFERVTQNIEAIYGIGQQFGNEVCAVGDFISFAVLTHGHDLVDEILPSHLDAMTSDQLARIQNALSRFRAIDFYDAVESRAMAMDIFQRTFTDDGNGNGRITAAGLEFFEKTQFVFLSPSLKDEPALTKRAAEHLRPLTAPFSLISFPTRQLAVDKFMQELDELVERIKMPFHETIDNFPKDEADDTGISLILNMLPPKFHLQAAFAKADANQRATIAVLAAYRYQRKHGQFPDSIDQLVGEFLDELPLDPFDSKPLRYRREKEGFRIYSIGFDRVDNGGQRILVNRHNPGIPVDFQPSETETTSEPGSPSRKDGIEFRPQKTSEFDLTGSQSKGDWVLWPRLSEIED